MKTCPWCHRPLQSVAQYLFCYTCTNLIYRETTYGGGQEKPWFANSYDGRIHSARVKSWDGVFTLEWMYTFIDALEVLDVASRPCGLRIENA